MPGSLLAVLVRWLACHLVTLILLGFLVAGLYLFGVFNGLIGHPTTQAAGSSPPASPPPQAPPAAASPPATPAPAPEASQSEPRPVTEAATPVEQGAVRGQAPAASPKPVSDELQQSGSQRPPPRLIGGTLPIHGTGDATTELFRPPAGTSPEAPLPASVDVWREEARRAFWNGDFERAEKAYISLIAQEPGVADHFGELGNLYTAMGRTEAALDAYYEAASRLRARTEPEKLRHVIGLLEQHGDPRSAEFQP